MIPPRFYLKIFESEHPKDTEYYLYDWAQDKIFGEPYKYLLEAVEALDEIRIKHKEYKPYLPWLVEHQKLIMEDENEMEN